MKILAISGHARHGKDTAAEMLSALLRINGARVLVAHQADLLKYICRTFFGWNGMKDEAGRSLLQEVGTDRIRAKDPDFWVRFLADVLRFFSDRWDYCIIPDTRFPNEIEFFRARGFDVTHLRIIRPHFYNGLTEVQRNHPSETALDDYPADGTILNDGEPIDLLDKLYSWMKGALCHEPLQSLV